MNRMVLISAFLSIIIFLLCSFSLFSQGTWTAKANFGSAAFGDNPSRRENAAGFSIGTKGYIGTGYNANNVTVADFWEWDQSTNVWTRKTDFGGTTTGGPGIIRSDAVGFSIGSYGYIGTGTNGASQKDFWEYDPVNDWWTKKTDFPGVGRYAAVGFAIGTKGYVGTGWIGGTAAKDFYEFDPADASLGTDVHGRPMGKWTLKKDFADVGTGGINRSGAVGFSIGTKGYVGMGQDGDFPNACPNDFYEYDPATDIWTAKTAMPGSVKKWAIGFSIGNFGYVGTGTDCGGSNGYGTFYQYDPALNTWTAKLSFPPFGGRSNAVGFSISCKGYIGTGSDHDFDGDFLNQRRELQEYCPDASNTSCSACSPLPVGMLSFTADCSGERTELLWRTATEENNDYFSIERSEDGKIWDAIGTVKGAGNSSVTQHYEFVDESQTPNSTTQLYYRLKQTDYDGKFEYKQPIVSMATHCIDAQNQLIIYPNPVGDELSFQFLSGEQNDITMEVYDVYGKLMVVKPSAVSKGRNLFSFEFQDMSKGIYMLSVKTKSSAAHQKFIKQ